MQDLGDAEQMSEIGAEVAFEAQGSDQSAQGDLALLAVPDRLAAFSMFTVNPKDQKRMVSPTGFEPVLPP